MYNIEKNKAFESFDQNLIICRYRYCKSIGACDNSHGIFIFNAIGKTVNVEAFEVKPQMTNTYQIKRDF